LSRPDDAIFADLVELAIDNLGFGPEFETNDEVQAYLHEFNEAERTVVSTWGVYNEIYNGGFKQLYQNSAAIWAPESVAGFRRIGLGDISALVEELLTAFPDWKTAVSRAWRWEFLKNNPKAETLFYGLDEKFCVDDNTFQAALVKFARGHTEQLGISA